MRAGLKETELNMQPIVIVILIVISGSVLGYFVLMACTPAESERNSGRTTSLIATLAILKKLL